MYEYKESSKLKYVGSKRLVTIAWICALLLIPLLYFTISGKATIDEKQLAFDSEIAALTQDKNACIENAQSLAGDLSSCNNDLSKSEYSLSTAQNDISMLQAEQSKMQSDFQAKLSAANDNLTQCQSQLSQLSSSAENYDKNLQIFAANAAKEICCRPGISSAEYRVESFNIICAGNTSVVC